LVNVSEGGMHCVVHDAESVLESGGRLESPSCSKMPVPSPKSVLTLLPTSAGTRLPGLVPGSGLFSPSWPTSKQNNCNDFSVTAGTEQVLRHAPAFY